MSLSKNTINHLVIIFVITLIVSCASTKSKDTEVNYAYDDDSLGGLTRNLSEFVQTVQLEQLCYPATLIIMFSVDKSGMVFDSDFKPITLTVENCRPDSNYIKTLKNEFESQMPKWVANENDSIFPIRISIPVRYR